MKCRSKTVRVGDCFRAIKTHTRNPSIITERDIFVVDDFTSRYYRSTNQRTGRSRYLDLLNKEWFERL